MSKSHDDDSIPRKKKKEGNLKQNFGHVFNKRDKRRDDNGPYPDSGVNKRKKRK